MSESKTGHLLWYPLESACPYTDHEWRIEREAHEAENTQALINLLRQLFHLPIRRDPKVAGNSLAHDYGRSSLCAQQSRLAERAF
jgi:hypothetical protein